MCVFSFIINQFFNYMHLTDTLCYSYNIHQHLCFASPKREKQPLTFGIWPCTYDKALLFPVERKQSHKTATTVKTLCEHDRSKNKIRSFLTKSEHPQKHGHCPTTKVPKHSLTLVNTSNCCFFTNYSFNLKLWYPILY